MSSAKQEWDLQTVGQALVRGQSHSPVNAHLFKQTLALCKCKIVMEVVACYPTSSKVPLCQYMMYMVPTTTPVCYTATDDHATN